MRPRTERHGTYAEWEAGCVCPDCCAASRAYHNEYRARRFADPEYRAQRNAYQREYRARNIERVRKIERASYARRKVA